MNSHVIYRLGILFFLGNCNFGNCQNGDTLFLTPLIKSGMIEEAQRLSTVVDFFPGVTGYSGLITVNEDYNSNLFFWFFPASINASTAPVMLWSEGGPGITLGHSLFNQNGPFSVDAEGNLRARNNSWHLTQNIIYLDNPVNVGFSFTQNETGNVDSGTGAAPDIYLFLLQFFQLFPDLQSNDFYNGGVSYGATYAISVAKYIHDKNLENPAIKINLKGVLLESPWMDSPSQVDYGKYLLNVGLIDEKMKLNYDNQRDTIVQLVNEGKYLDAFSAMNQLAYVTIMADVGYSPLYNILRTEFPPFNFTDQVTSYNARKALHVGNLTFSWVSRPVQLLMHNNFMASVKSYLEFVLNAGYKVIIFVGNLDVTTGHLGVEEMISTLDWDGKDEMANSTRVIWKVDGTVAGYARKARNFTSVLVRNAGHGVTGDQPQWGFDLVNRFTQDVPFEK